MKTVKTFNEFLEAYKADNELPAIDLLNDADEALANVLCQIYLGIFDESSHYASLTKVMLDRWLQHNDDAWDTKDAPIPNYNKVVISRNKLINICIEIDMKINDEMLCYYCAKTCEELGIGDMVAGGNDDDDIFIVYLYNTLKDKLMMHNLWALTHEQRINQIDQTLSALKYDRDAMDKQIVELMLEKERLENELTAVSARNR